MLSFRRTVKILTPPQQGVVVRDDFFSDFTSDNIHYVNLYFLFYALSINMPKAHVLSMIYGILLINKKSPSKF